MQRKFIVIKHVVLDFFSKRICFFDHIKGEGRGQEISDMAQHTVCFPERHLLKDVLGSQFVSVQASLRENV